MIWAADFGHEQCFCRQNEKIPVSTGITRNAARLVLLVRTAGLEPAPGFPEQILSLLRLPFRHVRSALAQPLLRLAAERADQPLQLLGRGGELFPVDAAQHQRDAEIAPSEIGIGADLDIGITLLQFA